MSLHPSISIVSPILTSYFHVAQILRRAVQTPPTPPPHPPPDLGKLPSSLPRFRTPSLPRVNPLPLPRVPALPPHWYPTRHNRHNQPRPVVATAAAVIDTIIGAKSSLQTHRSGPEKATWEMSTTNDFSTWHRVEVNPVTPPNVLKGMIPSSLNPNTPSPNTKNNLCQLRLRRQALQN